MSDGGQVRDAAEMKNRQQGIEARRAPRPSRRDARREPHRLLGVRRPVPDLGTAHGERPDPGLDLALGAVSVAHDAPTSVGQPLTGEPVEERPDLDLERAREHAPRPDPGDLDEQVVDGFRLAREERDAWVNWPARAAALMAAELSASRNEATGQQVTVEPSARGSVGWAFAKTAA